MLEAPVPQVVQAILTITLECPSKDGDLSNDTARGAQTLDTAIINQELETQHGRPMIYTS